MTDGTTKSKTVTLEIKICLGSSCFSRGNNVVVGELHNWMDKSGHSKAAVSGTLCQEHCKTGPNVDVNGRTIPSATFEKITQAIGEAEGK